MSTDNLKTFIEKSLTDESLATKIAAIKGQAPDTVAASLAQLSVETGTPVTAEEFLNARNEAISDEALGEVTGGMGVDGKTIKSNITGSEYTGNRAARHLITSVIDWFK